ncbi:MAG: spheroidene monooxygenase [Rubrivivax sp.]|nr:spheroidene monooxygenase [Rubrivivax sp.]
MKPNALQGPVPTARSAAPPAGPASPARPGSQTVGVGVGVGVGAARPVGAVAVLVLADMQPTSRLWAWGQLVRGARPFRGVPGLNFVKVMGSGAAGGFGMRPSGTHRGLFLVFDDEDHARGFVEHSPVLAAWRSHARELLVAVLRACSSKGSWSGAAMQPTAAPPADGPIAALTRASIRPRQALKFWRLSPPAELALAQAEGCLLAAGLGEAPLLRQCTFSLWTGADAMDRYARSGAHQLAIRTAYGGGHFSESMFVRFVPLEVRGTWQGRQHG